MRIISGEAKGRQLYTPSGPQTRPTADKTRGAIFNIIGSRVLDSRVLDLFGGSGALALEALSRGAESAVIVDHSRQAWQAIERNARNVLKDDFEYRARILNQDYRSAIAAMAGQIFDLVFLDPPYLMVEAYGEALSRLLAADMLAPGCLIVMERGRSAQVTLPQAVSVFDTRQYGDTAVDFAEVRSAEDEG